MFCPTINDKCVGKECRDWDARKKQCKASIKIAQDKALRLAIQDYFQQTREATEGQKFYNLFVKVVLMGASRDLSLTPEQRQAIEQVFYTPSAEIAGKLLRDANLL